MIVMQGTSDFLKGADLSMTYTAKRVVSMIYHIWLIIVELNYMLYSNNLVLNLRSFISISISGPAVIDEIVSIVGVKGTIHV
jgi:hypothetical protein